MNDLVGLIGWHVVAGTLALVVVSMKSWWRQRNVVVRNYDGRETWVQGPMGRVKLDVHGWPVGTESWRA